MVAVTGSRIGAAVGDRPGAARLCPSESECVCLTTSPGSGNRTVRRGREGMCSLVQAIRPMRESRVAVLQVYQIGRKVHPPPQARSQGDRAGLRENRNGALRAVDLVERVVLFTVQESC
jgi:hypothetical protein